MTKTAEPQMDFDQLLESATEEQLDCLLGKLEERRQIKEQERDERRRAMAERAKRIADANRPKTSLQIQTEFNSRHADVDSVIDPHRNVKLFEDGNYVELAGEVSQRAGGLDRFVEPTDILMKTRVRFDFFQTRSKFGPAAIRKAEVLEDNRRIASASSFYSQYSSLMPRANALEFDRVMKLIKSDLQRAASLSKLCDQIDELQRLHAKDEATRDRLIQQAIEAEEATCRLEVVDPKTLNPSLAPSAIETTMEV